LNIVEKRHERAERIRNRVRATMLVQDIEHFKTLSVVQSTLVVEEEPKRTLADSSPNLPFPEKTRRNIGRSRDQQRLIGEQGTVFGLTEPIENHVINVQVCLDILEDGKLESFRRPKRNHRGSNNQWRRRNRRRRPDTNRRHPRRRSRHMRRSRRLSRQDCRGNTAVRGERHSQFRSRRLREMVMGQRTPWRSSERRRRRHRCRAMMISHSRRRNRNTRRWRNPMRNPMTMEYDRRNRFRDWAREVV
jgi:hypothetical protein